MRFVAAGSSSRRANFYYMIKMLLLTVLTGYVSTLKLATASAAAAPPPTLLRPGLRSVSLSAKTRDLAGGSLATAAETCVGSSPAAQSSALPNGPGPTSAASICPRRLPRGERGGDTARSSMPRTVAARPPEVGGKDRWCSGRPVPRQTGIGPSSALPRVGGVKEGTGARGDDGGRGSRVVAAPLRLCGQGSGGILQSLLIWISVSYLKPTLHIHNLLLISLKARQAAIKYSQQNPCHT